MDIEQEIHKVLFQLGQDIKIHKIDADNSVLEIDYNKYTVELMRLFVKYMTD